MTFGRCLKTLLSISNIRMSQLAKAINVDSSLVNRWVHEKRIPAVPYLKNIAQYLTIYINNPLQMKIVDELIIQLGVDISSYDNNEDIIYKILFRALSYSNSNKHLPGSALADIKTSINKRDETGPDYSYKLIYGNEAIYNTLMSLLELTTEKKNCKNKQIYLTYQNYPNDCFFSYGMLKRLKEKILESIQNGWYITFLIRLDCGVGGVIKFIDFILPLIKTGKVKLFYFNLYESFTIRKELYIVSNLGALSCFPYDSNLDIECAFFLQNSSSIEVLTNYVNLLITNNSSDIIQYYDPHNSRVYYQMLSKINERSGNYYSYNNSFSRLLIPESLYIKFLNQTDLSVEDKELSLQYHKAQYRSFLKNLSKCIFKDIYFLSILDQLCEKKVLYLYTCCGTEKIFMENQDIIDYLEHVVYIIKHYDNYRIAVVQNEIDSFINNITFYIKERNIVFLEVSNFTHRESDVHLSINNPVIVKAFITYYDSLWQKISPLNKDKQDIIEIVEDYIRAIKYDLSLE